MLWRPISIHALRKEGDRDACSYCRSLVEFLSTPSARRATWNTWKIAFPIWNFYPRPPRGGRLSGRCRNSHGREHFYPRPPQGGRPGDKRFNGAYNNFYPRPPQGGRRGLFRLGLRVVKFLSTPSARRATGNGARLMKAKAFLSTPSARRATAKTEKNISAFVSL